MENYAPDSIAFQVLRFPHYRSEAKRPRIYSIYFTSAKAFSLRSESSMCASFLLSSCSRFHFAALGEQDFGATCFSKDSREKLRAIESDSSADAVASLACFAPLAKCMAATHVPSAIPSWIYCAFAFLENLRFARTPSFAVQSPLINKRRSMF